MPFDQQLETILNGSKMSKGTGCGFVVYDGENSEEYSESFTLEEGCSVFQAELIAIEKCAEYLIATQCVTPTIIHSDSQAALKALGKETT